MNATAEKFGYPGTLVAELEHWLVLARPAQPTLGSLVLVHKGEATRLGALPAAASTELGVACDRIERALASAFAHDKVNYLALMMVDPDVHFHVLPRYAGEREFAGGRSADERWPGPPDVTHALALDDAQRAALVDHLRAHFARAR